MFETILTNELSFPDSGLQDISHKVPLPRFLKLEQPSFLSAETTGEDESESLCHYHFLAQSAHRMILTRAHSCLFVIRMIAFDPLTPTLDANKHRL